MHLRRLGARQLYAAVESYAATTHSRRGQLHTAYGVSREVHGTFIHIRTPRITPAGHHIVQQLLSSDQWTKVVTVGK